MRGNSKIQSKLEDSLQNLKKMVQKEIKNLKKIVKSDYKDIQFLIKEEEEKINYENKLYEEKCSDYMERLKGKIEILVEDTHDFIKALHSDHEFFRRYKIIKDKNELDRSSRIKIKKKPKFSNRVLKKKTDKNKENIFEGNQVIDSSTSYLKPKYKVKSKFLILFQDSGKKETVV